MKTFALALMLVSGHAFANDCDNTVRMPTLEMKQVLTDNLTRRSYEEYINKGWLDLGNDVYMQSSQGQVVGQMTRMTMTRLYDFYVQRLKDALDPSYGSGIHISSNTIANNVNSCLSQEQKDRCSNQINEFLGKVKQFENFQNKYRSNMFALVSMIETFNNEVQDAGNSGQVYPSAKAYNFVQAITNNTAESTEYKGWINISMNESTQTSETLRRCL
ncbi:hypothetical protein C0V70_18415 [Bacteriovorax stolpii]|uniref:Uncharacterized protein n=1 Tax=Bacteriovorax stolpii TaxID=960 RepID=A0A2K9NX11_BACTC|nr:hypothetical protein [Bacteriovorax stolpii]AUO00043.1 hypothetical protein C0V70_18415 [Bacteriovorax stolpii]TDP54063.1 hypothetical protein C8D79_1347 [Bacteriovorax stolpii]